MSIVKRTALALARTHGGGRLAHWSITTMTDWLPLNYLLETGTLLAFHHPSPSYPTHILLVPKERIASLMELDANDPVFLRDLFQSVQQLAVQFSLEKKGYRLVCNGGSNQDVPVLHFHLIGGQALV